MINSNTDIILIIDDTTITSGDKKMKQTIHNLISSYKEKRQMDKITAHEIVGDHLSVEIEMDGYSIHLEWKASTVLEKGFSQALMISPGSSAIEMSKDDAKKRLGI